MGYITERFGGAGKALSGSDAGGGTVKCQTISSGWHGDEQKGHAKTPKNYPEKVFDEFKELEEQRAKEALEIVQKKQVLIKWEGERERAIILQRLGGIESDATLE